MKHYTLAELKRLTREEIKELRKELAAHIGTEREAEARRINQLIYDVLIERDRYYSPFDK